jgi:hypothetical protein
MFKYYNYLLRYVIKVDVCVDHLLICLLTSRKHVVKWLLGLYFYHLLDTCHFIW